MIILKTPIHLGQLKIRCQLKELLGYLIVPQLGTLMVKSFTLALLNCPDNCFDVKIIIDVNNHEYHTFSYESFSKEIWVDNIYQLFLFTKFGLSNKGSSISNHPGLDTLRF